MRPKRPAAPPATAAMRRHPAGGRSNGRPSPRHQQPDEFGMGPGEWHRRAARAAEKKTLMRDAGGLPDLLEDHAVGAGHRRQCLQERQRALTGAELVIVMAALSQSATARLGRSSLPSNARPSSCSPYPSPRKRVPDRTISGLEQRVGDGIEVRISGSSAPRKLTRTDWKNSVPTCSSAGSAKPSPWLRIDTAAALAARSAAARNWALRT